MLCFCGRCDFAAPFELEQLQGTQMHNFQAGQICKSLPVGRSSPFTSQIDQSARCTRCATTWMLQ